MAEILLVVIDYLPSKDLKNALLVSKDFINHDIKFEKLWFDSEKLIERNANANLCSKI